MPPSGAPQEEFKPFDLEKFEQDFLTILTAHPSTPTEIISPVAMEMLIKTMRENPLLIADIFEHACDSIVRTDAFRILYANVPRSISIPPTDGTFGGFGGWRKRKPTPDEFVSPILPIAIIEALLDTTTQQAQPISQMSEQTSEHVRATTEGLNLPVLEMPK